MDIVEAWSINLVGLVLSFIVFFISALTAALTIKSKAPKLIFISVLIWYHLIFYTNIIFDFLPFAPDTIKFARALDGRGLEYRVTIQAFHALTTPIRIFGGGTSMYISTSIIAFSAGSVLIWNTVKAIFPNRLNKGLYVYITLIFLWPSAIYYTTIPLREGYFVLCFASVIWALFVINNNGLKILIIVNSTSVMYLLRPEVIPLVTIIVLFTSMSGYLQNLWLVSLFSFIPLFVSVQLVKVAGILGSISPETLFRMRRGYRSFHDQTYVPSTQAWDTWLDVFKDIPMLVFFFISSPLSVDKNPFSRFLISIDALFVISIIGLATACIIKYEHLTRDSWLFIIILAISVFSFSVYEFNVTGAARHRMPLVALIIPLASKYIANQFGAKMGRHRTSLK